MRKTLLSALAVAMLLGTSRAAVAQGELKPVVVVSFAGYDALMNDIGFIGGLGGNPNLAKGLEGLLAMMTGGKGLAGLDKTKPWGAVVQTDGQQFPAVVFVPVTDMKALLGALSGQLGEAKDVGDGVMEVDRGPTPVFLKQVSGWALIGQSPDALDNAPADPGKLIADLSKKYDLAVSVSLNNLPDQMRQGVVGLMQMGAQAGLQQEPGESDEQFAIRSKLTQQSVQQLVQVINDLESLLVGLSVDSESKTAYLDVTVTATPGSPTATNMADAGELKTNFAGLLLPDAAITARATGKMTEADVAQMKSSLASIRARAMQEVSNQGLPEADEKKAQELLDGLLNIIEETVDTKHFDGAVAVRLGPDVLTVAGGGQIADGAKLEKLLGEIAEVAKKENPAAAQLFRLNAEQHEGVNLHVISVPFPADTPDAEKMAKLIGNTLEIVIGTGPNSVFVVGGRDAQKTIKEVITASKAEAGKEVLPAELSIAAGPIAKFVAAAADEPQAQQVAGMIASVLEQSPGKDHVTITSKTVPNGGTMRIEIEEGILKALGTAATMAGGVGGAPPSGF